MGVHKTLLDLTTIDYDKENDTRMSSIICAAHVFLQSFCYMNAQNQALLNETIDLSKYPSNEWEANTMSAIYADNAALCNRLSERLVQNFVQALEAPATSTDRVHNQNENNNINSNNSQNNDKDKEDEEEEDDGDDDDIKAKLAYLAFLRQVCLVDGCAIKASFLV